jgi:hypothetical protein
MRSSISNTTDDATEAFEARASAGGFWVLACPWLLLGLFWTWLALYRPGSGAWTAVAICAGIVLLWVVWLRGFRVRIADGVLEYRDGLYRTQRCLLEEIQRCEWVADTRLWLVVALREGGQIAMNPKPFSRADVKLMRDLLKPQVD